MPQSQLNLVVGVFFEKKQKLNIGFDKKIVSRVRVELNVVQSMFSGFIDKEILVGTAGIFNDRYGMSEIQIILFQKVELKNGQWKRRLNFSKTYQGNFNHTVYYKVFAESKEEHPPALEWNGTWLLTNKESGVVTFKTIAVKKNFFKAQRVEKLIQSSMRSEGELFEIPRVFKNRRRS